MLIPVILAGGSGTRLWPMSRKTLPKQFMPLFNGQSLFQKTLHRASLVANNKIIVVAHQDHRFIVQEQLTNYNDITEVIYEPCARNTAAAIAYATLVIEAMYADSTLLVMPADHLLDINDYWQTTVVKAQQLALQDYIVTLGITPTHAHTGYGYIHRGKLLEHGAFTCNAFKEKPAQALAESYLQAGEYYWNSGLFCFKASTGVKAFTRHAPKLWQSTSDAISAGSGYEQIESQPFDIAIMEKADKVAVIPFDGFWSDIGAWDALAQCFDVNSQGNVILGDIECQETQDTFIYASNRLISTVGIKDTIIVDTPDALLVMSKDQAQAIKPLVQQLEQQERTELVHPHRVKRPWGAFESIDNGERFQVKRITVDIGQKLSLQKHHHRSEHWVVVKGTARVTRDDEVFLLSENQSTYIPIGAVHRLENIGKIPLEIIEVQSGAYLGEDDIIRLDDSYGRNQSNKNTDKAT